MSYIEFSPSGLLIVRQQSGQLKKKILLFLTLWCRHKYVYIFFKATDHVMLVFTSAINTLHVHSTWRVLCTWTVIASHAFGCIIRCQKSLNSLDAKPHFLVWRSKTYQVPIEKLLEFLSFCDVLVVGPTEWENAQEWYILWLLAQYYVSNETP